MQARPPAPERPQAFLATLCKRPSPGCMLDWHALGTHAYTLQKILRLYMNHNVHHKMDAKPAALAKALHL